jgi:hypothetical protein
VVLVSIYDTNLDVTSPGDLVTDFGNTSLTAATPQNAVDDSFSAFTSRGSGQNNNAGFPPFGGPVGIVINPSGPTRVSALRLYTGGDGVESDPADVKLEGSNNGGASYTTLLPTTALSLPDDRNTSILAPIDPLQSAVQEIRFVNTQIYTSYRLTINTVKQDTNTFFVSVGEIELLGTLFPILKIANTGGSITISVNVNGELFSKTNLNAGADVWHDEGPIAANSPITITPAPGDKAKFFRVQAQ